jgi:hypothetical protein
MNKKTSEKYDIESDKDIRVSGVQGGKIIGEKLALFAFIIGIPMLSIGIFTLFYMLFVTGFPDNWPVFLYLFSPQSLAIIIGLLLIIGGYNIYRIKLIKN